LDTIDALFDAGPVLKVTRGGTGISSFGTGVATFLGTPSSANLRAAVSDETGTGALVFATSPTLVTPALGTPASGVVTNLTGTASININGTVGATTATTGAFTDVTTSGTVTHNAGTANGVAYLNGSKVLTTGSALTFDGSKLTVKGGNAGQFVIDNNGERYLQALFQRNGAVNSGADLLFDGTDSIFSIRTLAVAPIVFSVAASAGAPTEQMRLTATGLGIGTSSPAQKLHVQGRTQLGTSGVSGQYALTFVPDTAGNSFVSLLNDTGRLLFIQGGNPYTGFTLMTLDQSGNLLVGGTTTPSGKANNFINLGGSGGFWTKSGGVGYFGTFDNYAMVFATNDIERARITSGGDFKIGTTGSSDARLYVRGAGTTSATASFEASNSSGATRLFVQDDGTTRFFGSAGSETARITADGNLVAGATDSLFRLSAVVQSGANRDIFAAQIAGASNGLTIKWNNATSTTRVNIQNLPTSATGLASGDLYVLAGVLMVA
jgi:hypothetical protein